MAVGLSTDMRGILFWSYDRLNGGKISRAYHELKNFNELDSDSAQLTAHRDEALWRLLEHATATTKFYNSFAGCSRHLGSFPVVTKHLIREIQENFLSNIYYKGKLFTMSTSGSTGMPFLCYQDENKRKRVNAEVIYFSEKLGYRVGKRIIVLRAVVEQSRKTKAEQWMQNIIQVDVSTMDETRIAKLLGQIEILSKGGSLLLAYASTFDILKDYIMRKGMVYDCNTFGLVSVSEMFFDETRKAMTEAFNCKCVSRYSNQENGILGQDDLVNNTFMLNEAHYIFEILKTDSDIPAEAGEIGRIVVTDLFNYAMPMIRYDTGDVGMFTSLKDQGIKKKAISNFGGRKIDMVYDADGNYLSPHKISVAFWSFPEVKQFQFIQKSENEYLVRLNINGLFNKEKDLVTKLIGLLGDSACLEFEYTNVIPSLDSGKRKYIQNDYYLS